MISTASDLRGGGAIIDEGGQGGGSHTKGTNDKTSKNGKDGEVVTNFLKIHFEFLSDFN
jgi:hypothetical protein